MVEQAGESAERGDMMIEFSNEGNDVFAAGSLSLDDVRELLTDRFGTDFTRPCFKCGVLPQEDDIWRIDLIGGVIREGHSRCFDG
jgi:hypothetical protein